MYGMLKALAPAQALGDNSTNSYKFHHCLKSKHPRLQE